MKYLFTPKRLAELESMIADAKVQADCAAQSGYQSGSEQDGHHDEGYQLSLQQVSMLDRRLRDLETIRSNAEIVIPVEQNQKVQFGNGVELIYPNGEVARFIVEGYVFGSSENRLSIHSPLGRAIIGAREGDEVIFRVGNRTITVVVRKIFLPSQAERFCLDRS
jgi:transcription elongation GreA/GreB family factor